jgi:hypothetical protein
MRTTTHGRGGSWSAWARRCESRARAWVAAVVRTLGGRSHPVRLLWGAPGGLGRTRGGRTHPRRLLWTPGGPPAATAAGAFSRCGCGQRSPNPPAATAAGAFSRCGCGRRGGESWSAWARRVSRGRGRGCGRAHPRWSFAPGAAAVGCPRRAWAHPRWSYAPTAAAVDPWNPPAATAAGAFSRCGCGRRGGESWSAWARRLSRGRGCGRAHPRWSFAPGAAAVGCPRRAQSHPRWSYAPAAAAADPWRPPCSDRGGCVQPLRVRIAPPEPSCSDRGGCVQPLRVRTPPPEPQRAPPAPPDAITCAAGCPRGCRSAR